MENPLEPEKNSHRWLRNGVFGTVLVAGIGAAILKVWDISYQNLKDLGDLGVLRADRKAEQNALMTRAKTAPMTASEFATATHAIERKFGKLYNSIIKEQAGIESEGLAGVVRGTVHRFNGLGPYTKAHIVFGTAFSTAATIGGYSLLNQNADLRHALRRNHQQLADVLSQKENARS